MRDNFERILYFLSAYLITSFSVEYTMYIAIIDARPTVNDFVGL